MRDYRDGYLCNVYPFGDVALARKSLGMMAKAQNADGSIAAVAVRGGGHQHADG